MKTLIDYRGRNYGADRSLKLSCAMKSVYIMLLVFFVCLATLSKAKDCPDRDVAAAIAKDSTRKCRTTCTVTADCTATSPSKRCLCDDLCGLSCYNPDAACSSLDGTLDNGSINTRKGLTYGKTAVYTCNDGYYRTGVRERICRSTKEWSHTPANCTKGCMSPTIQNDGFPNVKLATGFAVGTVATYECKTGFQLKNPGANMDVTCQNDFTWTPVQFECVKKNCGHPGTISDGKLDGDNFEFGNTVTYKCDPGYEIDGRAKRNCAATGKWSPKEPLPKCNPLTCPAPPVLKNGVVDDQYAPDREFDQYLEYSCNAGYKRVGPSQAKCNSSGEWHAVPTCVANLDCNFETSMTPTCGYTNKSGTFSRQRETQSNGFPGFSLVGNGVLRSGVAYPLVGDEEACIEVEFKTKKPGILKARASDSGTTKLLWTAGQSSSWTKNKFKLVKVKSDNTEVYLEFEATGDVVLDNIVQKNVADCDGIKPNAPVVEFFPTVPKTTVTEATAPTATVSTTTAKPDNNTTTYIIIGVVIGVVCLAILVFVIVCCTHRHRKAKRKKLSALRTENSLL